MAPMLRISLALVLAFCGAARAADETTYLYAAIGYVKTDPGIDKAASDASLVAGGATELSSNLDQTDSGFKVMIGWMPSRYLALEGGFASLGTATYTATFNTAAGTGGTARSEFRAGGIIFDALAIAPVSDAFSLFAKFGGIAASVVTNQTVTPPGGTPTTSNATARMFKPAYGAGAMYDFARNASVRLEVERFPHVGNETTGKSNIDMVSLGLLLKL
jgi:hypothetical protein